MAADTGQLTSALAAVFEEGTLKSTTTALGEVTIVVGVDRYIDVMRTLRDRSELRFEMLIDRLRDASCKDDPSCSMQTEQLIAFSQKALYGERGGDRELGQNHGELGECHSDAEVGLTKPFQIPALRKSAFHQKVFEV